MKLENTKLSIIIMLLVVVSLSVTYAYTELYGRDTSPSGEGGCFLVNYSDDGQGINNDALKSTVNYLEGASTEISLSRNTGCKIYTEATINIHTNSEVTNAPLENGAMKYKVMQGETEISTGAVAGVTADAENQVLATVPLTETDTTYTIYLWIDPTVSQGSYHQKSYSGYLYASSTQSSTVVE